MVAVCACTSGREAGQLPELPGGGAGGSGGSEGPAGVGAVVGRVLLVEGWTEGAVVYVLPDEAPHAGAWAAPLPRVGTR